MDKKEYFSSLISLYEAVGMTGNEEAVPQEQIADSGSDVMPQGQVQEETPEDEENQDMEQEIPQPQEAEIISNADLMEKQKFVKIFDYMSNMIDYGEAFIESIKCIDLNLVEFEIYKEVRRYTTDVASLIEKIKNYLLNIFNNEEYENVLHAYILFRTEFVTCMKGFRKVLKLDEIESEEKNENKNRTILQ